MKQKTTMLNISSYTDTYTAQTSLSPRPNVPTLLNENANSSPVQTDVYERADGSTATRKMPSVETVQTEEIGDENETRFRELLHQFIGQTLFGQMLKAMRATQEKNPYFNGGRAEEIFQGQLDMVLTDKMTKATSQTLSEPMYKLMKANMR